MDTLLQDFVKKKHIHKDVFESCNKFLLKKLGHNPFVNYCVACGKNCGFKNIEDFLVNNLPVQCQVLDFKKNAACKIRTIIKKQIPVEMFQILNHRKNYNCACCASCCNFAVSEFSYSQLCQKAQNGDNYAMQFTSIFIPYENEVDARSFFPEYFDFVKKYSAKNIYFYRCPKVLNNKCSDYEDRPQICRDYPDNINQILPSFCGYKLWQEENELSGMFLHALVEISEFYLTKIKETLSN